jgi:hypothetical protein
MLCGWAFWAVDKTVQDVTVFTVLCFFISYRLSSERPFSYCMEQLMFFSKHKCSAANTAASYATCHVDLSDSVTLTTKGG